MAKTMQFIVALLNLTRKFQFITLPVLGFCLVMFVSNRWGIGTTTDSASYLATAQNLSDGLGYVKKVGEQYEPFSWFPPLYPAAIALVSLLGVDVFSSALIVNACLFSVLLFLVGLIIHSMIPESKWGWFLGGSYLGTSINVLQAYGYVWSEALFLPLYLISIWLTHIYIARGSRMHLFGASTAVGLSILTRYAGVCLTLAASVALVLQNGKRFKEKAVDIILVNILPLLLFGGWSLRNIGHSGNLTDRKLSFSGGFDEVFQISFGLLSWIGGASLFGFSRLTLALLVSVPSLIVVGFFICHWWNARMRRTVSRFASSSHIKVLTIFGVTYFLFICGIWLTVDGISDSAETPRMLLPLQITVVVIATVMIYQLLISGPRNSGKMFRAGVAIFLLINIFGATAWASYKYVYGLGFRSKKWMPMAVVTNNTTLQEDGFLYTNFPQALYCISHKESCFVQMNDFYEDKDNALLIEKKLMQYGGAIYFFKDGYDNRELISMSAITNIFSPDEIYENSVGIIIRYSPKI